MSILYSFIKTNFYICQLIGLQTNNPNQSKMKTKLVEGLKIKFPGIQDSIIIRIADKLAKTVTTEDQVETAIEGTTIQQVIDSYADSRATEATATAVNNYEKKHSIKDGKSIVAEPAKTDPTGVDEPPTWAKAIIDQNKILAEKLLNIEGQKVTTERITKLREALDGAPQNLIGRFEKDMPKDLNDEQFTEWMDGVKADVEPIITALVQKGVIINPPASGGKIIPAPEASPEVKARIEERAAETETSAIKGLPAK